jgi:hypothetical protein
VLELNGVEEKDAPSVQTAFSQLFKEKILPILDNYLTQLDSTEARQRIESLTLDLGKIPREDFESVVLKKVLAQLKDKLPLPQPSSDQVAATNSKSKAKTKPIQESDAHKELLYFFVEKGRLPWWASLEERDPVVRSIDFLLEQEPADLKQLMVRWATQTSSLRRLVRHLRLPYWIRLGNLQLKLDIKQLTILFEGLLEIVGDMLTPVKRVEFLGVQFLSSVFLAPNNASNALFFWKSYFAQLADAEKISLREWLKKMSVKWQDRQYHKPIAADDHPLTLLFKRLSVDMSRGETNEMIEQLMALWSKEWLEEREKRIIQSIVYQLEQSQAIPKQLEAWVNSLAKSIAQLERADIAQSEILSLAGLIEKGQPKLSILQKNDKKSADLSVTTFSQAEEVFIDNGGLVILWPFLVRFFGGLELLEDRQFKDESAQHRAVGLLQYLVDGSERPTEYLCGLNKVICGMDPGTVLDSVEDFTEEEMESCDQFLEAVIANAPILKEMTIDGFRGSFLLRTAILKRGRGFWQLQVEKESFDIVLERFPWQWNHVKLPWMKEGVQVEWV